MILFLPSMFLGPERLLEGPLQMGKADPPMPRLRTLATNQATTAPGAAPISRD